MYTSKKKERILRCIGKWSPEMSVVQGYSILSYSGVEVKQPRDFPQAN